MADAIRYTVDLTDRVHHLVRVTMTVPADLAPGARLVLPTWTPGSYLVRNYVRHVQWIHGHDVDGEVALTVEGTTSWRLPASTVGDVEVTLELYANELTVRTNHVDDHHALLVGAATFLYVDGAHDRPCEVTIPPVPDHHRVWSLLPPGGADHTFVAADRDHLVDSAFEVGDLPSVRWELDGVGHELVWAGHGPAPDLDVIARDARAIGAAATALFDDTLPVAHYTVLCIGWDTGGGGLEHRDGAVVQVPLRTFVDPDQTARFQSLLAHEYLHLWNVKRLVPEALVAPDYERPTHTPSLWVAEGWTSYYDDLLPTRAGLWSSRRLLDGLTETLRSVDDSPGTRLQPLRQASHEAWTKHYVRDENTPNVATDYYAHGAMVAWELDLRLRAANPADDGLDAVLRLLWERHASRADGYTEADVLDAIATIGDDRIAALADERVQVAQPPAIDADLLATVGLAPVERDAPRVPDLGVRVVEDHLGTVFSSVLRDRPAWTGGVSGGDRLVAIDATTVSSGELTQALLGYEPGQQIELTVARGPRVLTLPVVLGEPRPGWRLVARDDADDAAQAAFARWTGQPLDELS